MILGCANLSYVSYAISYGEVMQLQNKADPNLNMLPPDHPYMNARELEAEAAGLMQKMLNTLYQSQYVLSILAS
jgi:hypothetical protein